MPTSLFFRLEPIPTRRVAMRAPLCAVLGMLALLGGCQKHTDDTLVKAVKVVKPALTVMLTSPQTAPWPQRIEASGNIAPWQEASIGAEIGGLKLSEVLVNVGDTVRKGQRLARISDASVRNDLIYQRAAVAEAEAMMAEASQNAQRARELAPQGMISRQELARQQTQFTASQARLAAARSLLASHKLRLSYTEVVAPDDGIISARTASVGAVLGTGTELFKLIRKGRLEWRAELGADDLIRVRRGQAVAFTGAGGVQVIGKVRQVAPTIDTAARTGLVYVDLPPSAGFKAGMFVSGVLSQGTAERLTIGQQAVVVRDGFDYAMVVKPDNTVRRVKLQLGARNGDLVELLGGLTSTDRVVASGGTFLNEGDLVYVVKTVTGAAAQ